MPQATDTETAETEEQQSGEAAEQPDDVDDGDTAADDAEPGDSDAEDGTDEPETFPRQYVLGLRSEAARYRERAKTAERRLHTALVAATGRLADPEDMPFDAAHLDDADALNAAIDELLTRKPHLKSRRVSGDVGQGDRGASPATVNLLGMLRQRA
ncbi:hypothetical protein M4D79_12130 [Mycolicibacterium novocastrense]|nr:hypothetical protein M4D79_12130 [Mycolicibacterium novocastrense]